MSMLRCPILIHQIIGRVLSINLNPGFSIFLENQIQIAVEWLLTINRLLDLGDQYAYCILILSSFVYPIGLFYESQNMHKVTII